MTEDEFQRELEIEREKRIQLLRATRAVMSTGLKAIEKKVRKRGAPLNHLVMGVRMVSDQLRMEFRAAPVERPHDEEAAAASADPLASIRLYRPAG